MNLKALLQDIVVKVSRDGRTTSGTGFYITRQLVVTCYHVLDEGGESRALGNRYWIRHDTWENWEQTEPVPACCSPERDTAVLRCARPDNAIAEVRLADWDREAPSRFVSRGYDANVTKWGIGATPIEGEIEDIVYRETHPRLRLKTEPGTVARGRSGSPLWSQQQGGVVGIIDWVAQQLRPGGGDEALAIPVAELLRAAGEEGLPPEAATIEREIRELYRAELPPDPLRLDEKVEGTIAFEVTDEQVMDELQRRNLEFGVLHVRDGKEQANDYGPLLNDPHFLEQEGARRYSTTLKYTKRLGVQFKCFVNYGNNDYNDIKQLLEQVGFHSVTQGARESRRAWFLLPGYDDYRTPTGEVNNFHYPA
jgi:hypothetical protein